MGFKEIEFILCQHQEQVLELQILVVLVVSCCYMDFAFHLFAVKYLLCLYFLVV